MVFSFLLRGGGFTGGSGFSGSLWHPSPRPSPSRGEGGRQPRTVSRCEWGGSGRWNIPGVEPPHPGIGFPINNVGNDSMRSVGNDKRDQAGMTALEYLEPDTPHPGPLPQGERESVGPRLTRPPHGIGPVSGPAHLVTSTGPSCHSLLPSCHSRLFSCHARRPHLSFPPPSPVIPASF